MIKKIIGIFVIVLSLIIVVPALAEDTANSNAPVFTSTALTTTATKIACVKTAIDASETAIATAFTTYNTAVSAAYATRANELAGAYSNSTVKTVQAGVKVSWTGFNKSVKSATKAWTASRNTAWSAFKTATKACKAPAGVSDSVNSSLEIKGQ
jgi:hypothetical protein